MSDYLSFRTILTFKSRHLGFTLSLLFLVLGISPLPIKAQNSPQSLNCDPPILSRLQRHRITPGESVASIAQAYHLLKETLIQLNPILQNKAIPVGQEILIPPFNGIRVEVPSGGTWQDLGKAYGIRADVLFELNGCQKTPKVVFIPGVTWIPNKTPKQNDYTGLKGYPLPSVAKVGLAYGWHKNPITGQTNFHSGIDLLASLGTPVLAADGGTVLFAGEEGPYGLLVIIDHGGGRQTRYAHLSRLQVKIEQKVKTGDILGLVGITGRPDIQQPHLHFEVRYKLPVGWVAQDPSIHFPADK